MNEESLKLAAEKLGAGVVLKGLMLKKAVLKNKCGKVPKDVLGWNYIVRDVGGICFTYYASQWGSGMTAPVYIECPVGIRVIGDYKIDFSKAIEIFHKQNCGDYFTEMTLSYPLYPTVTEPYWYIRSLTGSIVLIGADTGKVMEPVYMD